MNDAPPYVLDEQIGYLLRLASQRHASVFQANIHEGITPTQFSALIRLSETGGCSQNLLGRMAGIDGATIKGVVDRLRQKGLADIGADPNDKRRSLISLTERGEAMIQSLKSAGHDISRKTLAPLSLREQDELLRALSKMI